MLQRHWQNMRSSLISHHKTDNKDNYVNSKASCLVPKLNPFSHEVLHLMKYTWGKCNIKKYGKIKDGIFIMNHDQTVYDVYVQYIRRAPKQGEITDDFAVSFSEKIKVELKDGKKNIVTLKKKSELNFAGIKLVEKMIRVPYQSTFFIQSNFCFLKQEGL